MPLALDELKDKLANDPAAKGFYTFLMGARVANGEVHSAHHCTADARAAKVTLGEVLELNYSHDCMESAHFKFAHASGGSSQRILDLLNLLEKIPHCDEFVNTKPNLPTLRLFLEMFSEYYHVSLDAQEVSSVPAALEWLNTQRGYPADAKGVMDIFLDRLSEFSTPIFPPRKQEFAPDAMFLVLLPADFSIYRLLSVGKLRSTAIHLMFRRCQVLGSNLLILPPHVFELLAQVDESSRSAKLEIKGEPPLEKLLTVNMLCSSGMTLKEAWVTASKL